MKVLVACEESQAVTIELRKLGHEAYSCDLIDCSGGHPEWHIKQDVLPLINGNCEFNTCDGVRHKIKGEWDILIAHPPCTYMSKAGARWMYPSAGIISLERLDLGLKARDFFMQFINANCKRICVENPRPLKVIELPKPTQIIQPYEYGYPFSKATCLWLKGLPELKPTNIISEYKPYLPSNTSQFAKGKGGSRGIAHNANDASKTFKGIAEAMATQWGILQNGSDNK